MNVIVVEDLSKRYRIRHQEGVRYATLRDAMAAKANAIGRAVLHPLRSLSNGPRSKASSEDFFALKEVSFSVRQGERLGIIGRNGAGKSTLLKILSRITPPTTGRVRIKGRVASLLEVGTGFHPELSGRENIFLNGAILGMSRAEIRRRFDEIVSFAEVEKFLDTPVKRYSSGMYVRLAFAVAAHLEPEILIVDEVLAVGDMQFQKKCMGKMESVGREGRTVLFVSHNLQAVRSLCQRGLLLDKGHVQLEGTAEEVVERSLALKPLCEVDEVIPPERHVVYPAGLEVFRIVILNQHGIPTTSVMIGERFAIRLHYQIHNPDQRYRIGLVISASDQTKLATLISTSGGRGHLAGELGCCYEISVTMCNVLRSGNYALGVHIKNSVGEMVDMIENIPLHVTPATLHGHLPVGGGLVWLDEEWNQPIAIRGDRQ